MNYSINNFLCDKCLYQIEIFGAHRGGVYCQSNGYAKILWNYVTKCPYFKFDNHKKHKQLFELREYSKLLTEYDKLNYESNIF